MLFSISKKNLIFGKLEVSEVYGYLRQLKVKPKRRKMSQFCNPLHCTNTVHKHDVSQVFNPNASARFEEPDNEQNFSFHKGTIRKRMTASEKPEAALVVQEKAERLQELMFEMYFFVEVAKFRSTFSSTSVKVSSIGASIVSDPRRTSVPVEMSRRATDRKIPISLQEKNWEKQMGDFSLKKKPKRSNPLRQVSSVKILKKKTLGEDIGFCSIPKLFDKLTSHQTDGQSIFQFFFWL